MTRRGHREGSIYRRKDGRWAASLSLEGRKRKTFYGKTRKEVQEKLKVALHEQQQGTLTTGPQQTLKAYLERWLEEVHRFQNPHEHLRRVSRDAQQTHSPRAWTCPVAEAHASASAIPLRTEDERRAISWQRQKYSYCLA